MRIYRSGDAHAISQKSRRDRNKNVTGFSEKGIKDAIDRMKPLFISKSSVENPPAIPQKIQWVESN